MATISEQAKRFQIYTGNIKMQTMLTQMGKNGQIEEIAGPVQLLPVMFRWEVSVWRPQEIDQVQRMFQLTTQLAGDKMDVRELVEHLFKRMKETLPGRNFVVSAAFFMMQNEVKVIEPSKATL